MRRRLFSIFGLVAIVAFFLPWLKACEKVETGFELLILDSLKDLSFSSLSSLNTGVLALFVPVYAVMVAWLKDLEKATRPLHVTCGVLAFLSLWNIGIWGGLEISAFLSEWGTDAHVHSILMAKLSGVQLIGAVALTVFLVKWLRYKKFSYDWSCAVLIFPVFATVGMGFSLDPVYYGLWLYIISSALLMAGSLIEAIWGNKKGASLKPTPF